MRVNHLLLLRVNNYVWAVVIFISTELILEIDDVYRLTCIWLGQQVRNCIAFYRAMHFSAKRGIAIACRLSVCPSVTLVSCDHIGWNSWKIISPLVSPGRLLFVTQHDGSAPRGTPLNLGPKWHTPLLIWASEIFDHKLRPNGYR